MPNLYSPESDAAKRRRLDELFLDEPYLSPTMRARRLHEADAAPASASLYPVLAEISDDDLLRRLTAGRHQRLGTVSPTSEADPLWVGPLPLAVDQLAPADVSASSEPGRRPCSSRRAGRRGARTNETPAYGTAAVEGGTELSAQAATRGLSALPPDIMTVHEAACYLRVGEAAVRAWVKQARIPHARLGRHVRFRRVALQEWLAGLEKPAS